MPLKNPIPLGEVDFTENGRHTLEINRVGILAETMLRMRFTITNGVSAAVGPKWFALARLLKRVEIKINGVDTPVSIDGPGMVLRAIMEYGVVPQGMSDTVVLTGSAATSYDIFIPIAHYLPRSADPFYTALPVNRFRQATIEITYGDIDDIYTTANGATISAVTVDAHGKFLVNVDPQQQFRARVLDVIEEELTATSSNWRLVADRGTGMVHRSHMIQTVVDDIASEAILDSGTLKLVTGQYTFGNWDGPVLQADNMNVFEQASHQTGAYFYHTEFHGQPLWIPTDRASMRADLAWEFDAAKQSGTNKFFLYSEKIRAFEL